MAIAAGPKYSVRRSTVLPRDFARPALRVRMRIAMDCCRFLRGVRRQNIRLSLRLSLAECRPRLGVDVKRRACGAASADVGWSGV